VANRDTTQYGVQYLNDGIYDDEAHRAQEFFTGLHDRTCNCIENEILEKIPPHSVMLIPI